MVAGQRTCLHIHGVLPYLYVPCADISLQPHEVGDAYTHAVSLALEKAYIVTLSNTQHVKEFTFTFQCLHAQLYFSQSQNSIA